LLAFAVALIAFISCAVKRTLITLPIASSFGSFGRPTFFRVLLCWLKASKLLHNGRSNRVLCRFNRMQMQHCDVMTWVLWIIGIVRPRIDPVRRGMPD
jgi:hypothetical protein